VIKTKNPKKPSLKEALFFEKGTIVKKWGGKIPVCIVFPNTYYTGMSNLATHMLYKILNSIPEVVCERCFIEESGEVYSLESRRPLKFFEIIFFTISYELDYVNIPRILLNSSIPVISGERKETDPLLIAGGICVMANPEPIHDFFDLFLMGDIEATALPFMEIYSEVRENKRDSILEELSSSGWVYNPRHLDVVYNKGGVVESFIPPDYTVTINRYKGKELGTSSIVTSKTEFSNMLLVEGTRGCPSQCPFCLLGNTYHFVYDRMRGLNTNITDIGIIGGGVSFHPELYKIIKELKGVGINVHLPSLRVDKIPLSVIELIKDEVKTLTFGIEAGTERLRRFVGKPLEDKEIFEKIEAILDIKPFNLKLYFMIGLYGEERSDIESIPELVKHIKHIMIKKGAKKGFVGSITVHASPFVPKASTPFQWLPMDDMENMKDKISRLKKEFGKIDNTYFTHESIKFSFIQGIFARGDRRVGTVITKLNSGESFQKVFRESPVNLNFYVLRKRDKGELFPWDFIGGKNNKDRLYKKFINALSYIKSPGPNADSS